MAGSITYEPYTVPLARSSATILCYRLHGSEDEGFTWELLPNIRCMNISYHENDGHGMARFRYVFVDPQLAPTYPRRIEQVLGLDAVYFNTVQTDDRVAVRAFRDDGYSEILFDGFVQVPQGDLNKQTETVSFVAMYTPIREFDTPLSGAFMRDADDPTTVSDIQTKLPARFNPGGHPNATPEDADANALDEVIDEGPSRFNYPTFLGPLWPSNVINGSDIRMWTLGMSARYVVAKGVIDRESGKPSQYIRVDDLSILDDLLRAVVPVGDDDVASIDTGDPATFTYKDIETQDIDVRGEPWPTALANLIMPHGFAFTFELSETDPDPETGFGDPVWTFRVYRKDFAVLVKDLNLQQAGNQLNPGLTNLGAITVARDIQSLVNRIILDCQNLTIEASFVLAPSFDPVFADAASPEQFISTDLADTAETALRYRNFILDEVGEGHWQRNTLPGGGFGEMDDTPPDLKKLLGEKGKDSRTYVKRLRQPHGDLVTVDVKGKALQAQLHVSLDYTGPSPGLWDGTGTWTKIDSHEWKLLKDQIGIQVTAKDPNSWPIGTALGAPDQLAAGKMNLVEWLAAPTAAYDATKPNNYPYIMLTTRIDHDQDMGVHSDRRAASPTVYGVTRRVMVNDRFRKRKVSKWSKLADPADVGKEDRYPVDDTEDAQAFSDALRKSLEAGTFAGTAKLLRLSTAYTIGDRIRGVVGRNISFRSNAGEEAGESPIYPTVVGLTWELDGEQNTFLELADVRNEPAPEKTRGYDYE